MEISNVGIGASVAVVVIGLLTREALKTLLSKWFSTLSKTEINVILVLVIAALAVGAIPITAIIEQKTAAAETPPPLARYKEDAYVDAGKVIIDEAEELAANKRRKDSIHEANKPQKWVYQIGPVISEKSALFDRYRLVRDLGDVFIFRESRKSYLIILDKGYSSQAQYQSELDNFRQQMAAIENDISVINLMSYCSWKESLAKVENVREKKEPIELPCMECKK